MSAPLNPGTTLDEIRNVYGVNYKWNGTDWREITIRPDSGSSGGSVAANVSINQTTPGTSDSVTVKASQGIGSLTETAPESDTASSGLNGRLQRVALNISAMHADLVELQATINSSLGSNQEFNSFSVTPATDSEFKLATGINVIGSVGVDQTTDGVSNKVVAKELHVKPVAGGGLSLAIGAASVASAGINASLLWLTSTVPCWIESGANPTAVAVTSLPMLSANIPFSIRHVSGEKIAVIQASGTTGTLYITPMV